MGDCPNCSLAEYAGKLTDFEAFCLIWHYENVNYFTFQTGILGESVKELELKGLRRRLFLKAQNMIYNTELSIEAERRDKEMSKRK